jgi:hypothetical protein
MAARDTINDAGQKLSAGGSTSLRRGPSGRDFRLASSSLATLHSNPIEVDMAKLKLGVISDGKPLKVAHEFPHRSLKTYSSTLKIPSFRIDQPVSDRIRLIGPMLERFTATNREFMKALRSARSPKAST